MRSAWGRRVRSPYCAENLILSILTVYVVHSGTTTRLLARRCPPGLTRETRVRAPSRPGRLAIARFRIGILALPARAPNTVTDSDDRDHFVPCCCSAGLSVHLLLFARESDLFGASLHARRPRPRPSAQGPPHARELGCMCMRTHAGACSQARRASSERGHLQEPTSGPSPERPRAHARTTGASPSSSSSSLAPILATSELGCAVAPPEPFPRAHTRARTHTFAQPRTATYSHEQPRTATTTQRCLRGQLGPGASHTSATAQL